MPSLNPIIAGMAYHLWELALKRPPPVPAGAKEAAHDLQGLYLSMNKRRGSTLREIMEGPVGKSVPGASRDAGYFGVLLAENALAIGPYTKLGGGLRIPSFTVKFDGTDFTWEGGDRPESHRSTTRSVHDLDDDQDNPDDLDEDLGAINPAGLTAKGERMYKHIKLAYAGDPRADEIAARTVLERAKHTPGLKKP